MRRGPLELAATVPPTVAPGSGVSSASCCPAGPSLSCSSSTVEPAGVEDEVEPAGRRRPALLGTRTADDDRVVVPGGGGEDLSRFRGRARSRDVARRYARDGVAVGGGTQHIRRRRHQNTSASPASCSGCTPLCLPGTSP